MDMVTTYPYEDLDTNIYMKVRKGLVLTGLNSSRPRTLSIQLRHLRYILKQCEFHLI